MVGVDHVIEAVAAFVIPEPGLESGARTAVEVRALGGAGPADGQRVEPQGLDLDRFADAR